MENFEVNHFVQPLGRKYDFTINGYLMTFMIKCELDTRTHPVDIIAHDLAHIQQLITKLVRFPSVGKFGNPNVQPQEKNWGIVTIQPVDKSNPVKAITLDEFLGDHETND